jgi:hypothetical protein
MKIRQLGAEFFHADGWTEKQTCMTKLTVAFPNFTNAPENSDTTTTVHLSDCQAECLRALQKRRKILEYQ